MTVVYPREFEGNQKFEEGVERQYWEEFNYPEIVNPSAGMKDLIVLYVSHVSDEIRENYNAWYIEKSNHKFTTYVDCRYHSKNLNHLIKKLTQIEEIL